jgi:hypothetical protein
MSAVLVALSGCAHQATTTSAKAPGFLTGYFHGLIAPLALVGQLFWNIRVYAVPNDGFWYDCGFLAGFASLLAAIILAVLPKIGGRLVS